VTDCCEYGDEPSFSFPTELDTEFNVRFVVNW
jgi:hypothetical protein